MTKVAAVEAKELTICFGKFTAVNNISFTVNSGEIFGFLGANGAGKTTTIRAICGLIKPTHGEITVQGIRLNKDMQRVKSKVGYMSQKFTLYDDLTVEENLQFAASLRKLSKEYYQQRCDYLFSLIKFDQNRNTMVRDLPSGIMQQVALIAASLHDPDIIFLDEPTAGVTPAYRARFWELIKRVAESGKTVFVTTHYMDEAEQCDRIAMMRAGEIVALDSPVGLKKKTFTNTLYEISDFSNYGGEVVSLIKDQPWISSFNAHGMRYHLSVTDEQKMVEFLSTKFPKLSICKIEPSLEDVFIRIVEGANR